MREFIYFLEKWQTFIGAFIGGVVGLLSAILVARDARRREERAAAMLLINDLAAIRNDAAVLDKMMSEKTGIAAEEKARLLADKLLEKRSLVSPLFESSMWRVASIDDELAVHLSMFRKLYLMMDAQLTELADAFKTYGK